MQLALVGSMATRRPRGLGVLQLDDGLRRRRPRHPHPQQPQQRRRDRGQRLPVAGRRGDPEVHARGLRADGVRGALEGAARSSAATSAASRSRCRTARPASSCRSPEECADRSLRFLREPDLGKRLGRAGKEHVRKHFLTPRLLRDWLRIFQSSDDPGDARSSSSRTAAPRPSSGARTASSRRARRRRPGHRAHRAWCTTATRSGSRRR